MDTRRPTYCCCNDGNSELSTYFWPHVPGFLQDSKQPLCVYKLLFLFPEEQQSSDRKLPPPLTQGEVMWLMIWLITPVNRSSDFSSEPSLFLFKKTQTDHLVQLVQPINTSVVPFSNQVHHGKSVSMLFYSASHHKPRNGSSAETNSSTLFQIFRSARAHTHTHWGLIVVMVTQMLPVSWRKCMKNVRKPEDVEAGAMSNGLLLS